MKRMRTADLVNLVSDGVSSHSQGLTSNATCEDHLFISPALIRDAICHMVVEPEQKKKKTYQRKKCMDSAEILKETAQQEINTQTGRGVLKARRRIFQIQMNAV